MVLRLDRFTPEFPELYDKFRSWLQETKKLKGGEISKDLYDDWRYKYPELDTHQFSVDILPREISMRAELQTKKEVVKERDEHREKKQQNKGTEMQVWNNMLCRIRRIKSSPDPFYLIW